MEENYKWANVGKRGRGFREMTKGRRWGRKRRPLTKKSLIKKGEET